MVARSQLLELGLSTATISEWVAKGRLHRIHPRVYAVGHPALDLRGRMIAALLYAGPGAALSHQTAGFHYQLLPTQPKLIHVRTPRDRRSRSEVAVHTTRELQRVRHNGLPVTTVESTLLDLAATLSFGDLRRALAEADFRRVLDVAAIRAELGRGKRGAAALRQALSLHSPELAKTRSELECRFLELCERQRVPPPEINQRVAGVEVDALWRDQQLIVELDGVQGHHSPAQIHRDHRRDLRLRQAGYAVRRYSWEQVTSEGAAVAADLRQVLSST